MAANQSKTLRADDSPGDVRPRAGESLGELHSRPAAVAAPDWRELAKSIFRPISFLLIFLFCGLPSAHAQQNFEFTPFVGSRFHGVIRVDTPQVDHINIKSSIDYGVLADYQIWPSLEAEFMWNRQPTSLSAHNIATGTITKLTNTNLDMYQFSALYQFRSPEAKLRPFFVTGLGFVHYGPEAKPILNFTNRFAWNVGGGIKYFFTRHVGFRFETRWSPSHTTSRQSLFCDPFFGCVPTTVANKAQQFQANVGIIFRVR